VPEHFDQRYQNRLTKVSSSEATLPAVVVALAKQKHPLWAQRTELKRDRTTLTTHRRGPWESIIKHLGGLLEERTVLSRGLVLSNYFDILTIYRLPLVGGYPRQAPTTP